MADDTPGRVAATLAGIRERAEQAAPALAARRGLNSMADSAEDVPRLLKALDAALKLADGARIAMSACGVSGPCSCGRHPVAWTLDPDKLRAAITAALTGTQPGEDENHG